MVVVTGLRGRFPSGHFNQVRQRRHPGGASLPLQRSRLQAYDACHVYPFCHAGTRL
jgi:hypothetical protein